MTLVTALMLTALTGFSGLVYEVAWQKYLAALLGCHSEATAAVLALFLGGLSAGYALFGRATQRLEARAGTERPRLLRFYGLVEGSIGAYALAFPLLFEGARALSLWLPTGGEGLSFALDVVLSGLLIGLPSVLMGGTIPVLTQALAKDVAHATRVHALIYACNTAGAFAGALAAGFVLVHWLGLDGSLRAMGLVNLAAGATFVALDRRRGPEPVRRDETPPAPAPPLAPFAAVALLAGFAMMTVQTVLNRLGALAFGPSHFTFAMVVAAFVLCIALGSFAVSALPRISGRLVVGSQWLLVALLLLLYGRMQDAPYWAHVLRSLFRNIDAAFYPYYLFAFVAALAVLALPIGLSGALLPLLFHHLRDRYGDLGQVAGRLYAWNTLGSLAGALLGGYLLLFWLDLDQVFRVALGALVVGGALLSVAVLGAPRLGMALVVVPALLGIALLKSWAPERLASGAFRQRTPTEWSYLGPDAYFAGTDPTKVVFYEDDPTASVAVKEVSLGPNGGSTLALFTDGRSDSALLLDNVTLSLAALVPSLFAEKLEKSFVIGYGTGVTAGELARLEDMRSVRVAEISRGVIDAAPLFDYGTWNASSNPKIQIIRSDAYRALLRSPERYDVIVSEPSNPWRNGVEMLYSREFLEAARSKLAPGGVYSQWMHLYEMDEPTVNLVIRTYSEVFDAVTVWYTIFDDILLVGFQSRDRALDVAHLARRAERPDISRALDALGIEGLPGVLAHELLPLGSVRPGDGPVHTLVHPILSDDAARAFFLGNFAPLPRYLAGGSAAATSNSLLRRLAGNPDGPLPEAILAPAARETCRRGRAVECSTMMAAWWAAYPHSPILSDALAQARANAAVAAGLGPAQLERLSQLYAGGIEPGRNPLATAERASQLFAHYFHFPVPFDRGALAALWRRCSHSPKLVAQCRAAQNRAEQEVGSLDDRVAAGVGG